MYVRRAVVSLLLLLPSCDRRAELGPEHSVPKEQRPLAWNVPDGDRLGLAASGSDAAAAPYVATLPAGWTELPPAPMRDLNWKAGDAECALLGEVRGSVEGNVNRWLAEQYGQPKLSAVEIDRLPVVQLLGAPGRLVEAEGTGGKQPGMKLLAIVADHGNHLSTLKMTGPKAAVDAQKAAFLALAPTIRRASAADVVQGPSPDGTSSPGANGAANTGGDAFEATLPAGWSELPPTPMRNLNLKVGDVECTFLAVVQGTVESNINRWEGQFGGAALTPAQIDALPTSTLLGAQGRVVEAAGTFQGKAGMKLLGIVAEHGGSISTLKMTGPAAAVDAQRAAFLALAPTIRARGAAPAGPQGPPRPADSGPADGAGAGGSQFEATLPAGWSELPPTPMRNLNLKVGLVECTFLAVVNSTVESNINRWEGQFGGAPLTPAQIDALPTSTLLGAQGRVVEAAGTFQGKAGMKLLGIVAEHGGSISTLKMTGPAAAVDAQRAAFLALAPTIRARGAAPVPFAPAPGAPAPAADVGGADAQPFTAKAPPSWRAKTDSGKLLHYVLPQGTEVYLGQLSGDLPSLVTVWRGQMGLDPIDEAGIKKLPTTRMLGGDAVLLDLEGTLNDVTSGRTKPGYRLLLAALAQGSSTTFVKCLGPAAEVSAQREAFQTFCSSIRRQP